MRLVDVWLVAPFILFALFIVSAHAVNDDVHTSNALTSHLFDLLGDAFLDLCGDGSEFATES